MIKIQSGWGSPARVLLQQYSQRRAEKLCPLTVSHFVLWLLFACGPPGWRSHSGRIKTTHSNPVSIKVLKSPYSSHYSPTRARNGHLHARAEKLCPPSLSSVVLWGFSLSLVVDVRVAVVAVVAAVAAAAAALFVPLLSPLLALPGSKILVCCRLPPPVSPSPSKNVRLKVRQV